MYLSNIPPVDLYLIFEKSSCKNQFRQTGFLVCKTQFQNWFLQATCWQWKPSLKWTKNPVHRTWLFQIDFSEIKYRSTGYCVITFSENWKESRISDDCWISRISYKVQSFTKLLVLLILPDWSFSNTVIQILT